MNMPENLYLEFDAFLRSIKQNLDGSFGVLLGAGASISSGIQSANDCIWDWKFLIYQSLSGNQKKLVDPKKSDLSKDIIQKWLDVQGKYPQLGSPEEYSFYAEASYPIDADRTKYFESLCNGKSPYVGYKLLCLLNKYGIVKSVWSTNFDGLVERAAQQANITPIAINLDCVDRIYRTESSSELLYIALHGDCKFRTLKNTKMLSDYVHHYTGFSNIYNCRLDIPEIHSEKWVSINDNPKSAINLAKTICTEGQKLSEQFPGIVLLIFVPNSWSNYRQFNYHGETFDLHNYIKAFAAQHRFTTQFIEEKTLYDKMVCEISWWLSLALFVKALRTPWTLADLDQNTAYAGIGYSIKKQYSGKAEVILGCSHIYNAQGQGLRYKLSKVEHPQFDKKKNPYLNFEEAYKFGMDILALFQDAMEKLPQRVVVHKRTPFKNDEIEGITNALKQAGISEIDLITITQEYDLKFIAEKIMYGQFLEDGYPVDRGTCIKLSSRNALLWTHGVVPSIQSNRRYYQGGRCIPAPLKITKYYGHGDLETIAKEILGFTKMNWNSFNLYTKLPATIDTSNTLAQVGNLLRQYNGVTYDYRFFI